MNELNDTKLSRPLDKSNLSNDNATLRNLLGVLNNPAITGAEIPEDLKESVKSFPSAQTPTKPEPPPPATPAVAVSPAATPVPPTVAPSQRLLLTGRGLSEVAKAIGAQEFAISAPIIALARHFFPNLDGKTAGAENFLSTIKAFGSAEFSANYPASPARATFVVMVRTLGRQKLLPMSDVINWDRFGFDEGFWIDSALAQAVANGSARSVITGIASEYEYKFFVANGFQHWHVTARTGIKSGSGGPAADKLNTTLDNDVTKKISQQREGKKLRVIWNDTTNPISNRLWLLSEFVTACGGSIPSALSETNLDISFE